MNSDELVGLISHFDMSWEKLRQNLVYERGAGLEGTVFRGQDPIAVMKAAVSRRRQVVDAMLDRDLQPAIHRPLRRPLRRVLRHQHVYRGLHDVDRRDQVVQAACRRQLRWIAASQGGNRRIAAGAVTGAGQALL